ncbi:LacI family transcriptional regulator [Aliikangiella marina]|uniref:LacI family transcriptional regulator n=1 Tax=Aliikangiella marina TaxID=1712262 RepID=A0A545TCW8_9GAMM|nr:LacI family DNA-binding transcriptional regulator [Aliikangiella marina]TQV75060.1 LacI family transcriptional regulator [Aliikangiella marina]
MQKVTINDVAEHAGVSKKTVSRVLNNEPNVSKATKEKVLEVFKELGYRPSAQARGLATNQSFLIGLVYDNPNKTYVSDVQTGALEICNENGYHLVIHPTDHEREDLLAELESLITDSRLDGVVLTPPFSDMADLLSMLQSRAIPYAKIGPTILDDETPSVISNDLEASYEMTRYLISLGHTKIGFIKGHPDHNVSNQRLAGYRRALEESQIQFNNDYVAQGYFTFTSGEECAKQLLSLPARPTAIFASNDYMAAGVIKVASQENIAVPQELSVAGFDNAPISRYLWPTLTTVKQPIKDMATDAARLLLDAINKRPLESSLVQLTDELIVRDSSAPLKST